MHLPHAAVLAMSQLGLFSPRYELELALKAPRT